MPKTTRDLQQLTGLGINQVYAGIKVGELPGHYVGKRVVIPDEAFERFSRGDWVPTPRPYFRQPVKPLPQARELIHKRADSNDGSTDDAR